jgi:hypothetical protein
MKVRERREERKEGKGGERRGNKRDGKILAELESYQ